MDNTKAKIASVVVKAVIGLTVSAGIGYAIKAERWSKEQIDDYFATKTEIEPLITPES